MGDQRQATTPPLPDERELVDRLRMGDEDAFRALVRQHHPTMVRVARTYVGTSSDAQEVVQEAWLGVLKGLDTFEERSSLKTWIFRILVNCAKTRGVREQRSVPFSSLAGADVGDGPSVDPDRFRDDDNPWAGHWVVHPSRWSTLPEEHLAAEETFSCIKRALAELPAGQRIVLSLRDVEGWSAAEVCTALDISAANQRVLLHRARSRVRAAIERELLGVRS